MKRIRFLFLIISFALSVVSTLAKDKVEGIIIELSSGNKLEFKLSDNPKFIYNGGNIVLKTNEVELKYSPSEIIKVVIGQVNDDSSIIENINNDAGFIMMPGYIRIHSSKPEEIVVVYSISGEKITSYKTDGVGNLLLPLNSLPKGIHIVIFNNQSIKVSTK